MAAKDTPVGWVGLGAMGSRMAKRLIDAGYTMTVYNRAADKMQDLADSGAAKAESPKEVAERSEIVFTSLSNDAAVESVYTGDNGILDGVRQGSLLIEMSTILPDTVRRIADEAQRKGVSLLDAPVSGSTPQAESGALVVLAGGADADFERARPFLLAIGKDAFHMGPLGAGASMKLVVNTMLGLGLQALAESLSLGVREGLDQKRLLEVLSQTAHVSPGQKSKMENVKNDDYPPQFPMRLLHKDFGLVLHEAKELRVPMPMTAAAQQMFSAQTALDGELDCSSIIRFMLRLTQA